MTRFVAVGFVVFASLAGVRMAHAEGMPLPNSAVLGVDNSKFYIMQNGERVTPADPQEHVQYFNFAHCVCSQMMADDDASFGWELTLSAQTNLGRPVVVMVGTDCADPTDTTKCIEVGRIPDIDTIRTSTQRIDVPVFAAINGDTGGDCATAAGRSTAQVWLMVDLDGSGNTTFDEKDHWIIKNVGEPEGTTGKKGIDVQAPELGSNFNATGSEDSVRISWTPSEVRPDDPYYFQAFCATMDDQPVIADPPEEQYDRALDVCEASTTFVLNPAPLPPAAGEIEVPTPSAGFTALDPRFLCGESSAPTASSLTIEGLENGKQYKVALAAIDYHGNVAATYFTRTVTPQPVTDFWEDLNDRDSAIDGGCLLSKTYGDGNPLTQTLRDFRDGTLARSAFGRWLIDAYYATIGRLAVEWLPARILVGIALAPFVAVALLWHFVGLPILLASLALALLWRRRRWVRTAAVAVGLLAAPAIASAQTTDPDSLPFIVEDEPSSEELGAPPIVKWIAGIRVGPYIPDIDLQFGKNGATGKGPYESMFGDYYFEGDDVRHDKYVWQVLPMLDVARVLWSGSGQLAVGGSLGYMQKTAYAYLDGTSSNDPMRPRSEGSKNTFRLIPFSANVTYRFTQLDDLWSIPVVPYLRGGLSYYMWWMTGPNGDVSKVDGDKAYGGTPGIEGAAGIAIRAERVDADAARSMRNSGLQHAGFYGEISWARVDGFDSSSKLWVGDTTWFAGVLFEF